MAHRHVSDRSPGTMPSILVALGAVAIVVGVSLPWLTFFAGLHPVTGFAGRHGLWLVAAGASLLLLGVIAWRSSGLRRRFVSMLALAVSSTTLAFVLWLITGLMDVVRASADDPMRLARVGPGLFVCGVGALLAIGGALALLTGERAIAVRRHPGRPLAAKT